MIEFPQRGGCLCGAVGYELDEDPVTLYACHCTDCQRQTGSSFALSMIVRRETLRIRGQTEEYSVKMDDGRIKQSNFCSRCTTRLWNPTRIPGLALLEPGTLDDTTWLRPVAHIWTRSAQGWLSIPEDSLRFEKQPVEDDYLELTRAWKARPLG